MWYIFIELCENRLYMILCKYWKLYAKEKKLVTKDHILFTWHEIYRIYTFIEITWLVVDRMFGV